MGLQALDGALALDSSLRAEANKGHHCQTAVLHLLQLPISVALVQGVKGSKAQETALASLLVDLVTLGLDDGKDNDLDQSQGLVVDGVLLGSGLPPVAQTSGVSEQDAGDGGLRGCARYRV